VPLKILIADDSMTAQNMGKKILVDAGFEVIACSNGAAAIKKIAETKPDIIILDIYMPGYTGLEVCDKVKAAPETANVPVLLTVGKLEPYRPEEGAKVKAEGVIIKPFEASDLLTALGKIAQKYNLKVPQIEPIEIKPREHVELPHDATYGAWKQDASNQDHEATVRTEPPKTAAPPAPGGKAEPAYEKTMRLSAKDLQAMLDKGPSEAAKAAAAVTATTPTVSAAPLQNDPNESTQKLEVPSFVREEEAKAPPAAVVAPEPETPMFAIEETPAESPLPAYESAGTSAQTPAYMMDEPAAAVVEKPQVTGGSMPFSASSVPDEEPTGSFTVVNPEAKVETPGAAPTPSFYEEPAADAVSLDFLATPPAAPAAAPPEAQHELETFAPVEMPEVHHMEPELETTAAAKIETHVENLMELETTGHRHEVGEIEHAVDPALVTSPDELMQFTIKVGTEKEEPHVEHDPLAKEQLAALYTEQDVAPPPTEEVAIPEAEPAVEESKIPHSYHDDPLVQMGVISIEHSPSDAATAPSVANEFKKPVTADEEPAEILQPASGVLRAIQEYESHTPTDEALMPDVIAAQMAHPEAPPVAAPVPEPAAEDESMKKFATELHEAIAFMPSEPHHEPEAVAEPEVVAKAVPSPVQTGSLADKMAAANPAFSDALPAPPAPEKERTDSHDHELAKSLSAALDNVAKERTEGTRTFAVPGMETAHVAKAVQRVFERYKEQMIADITDELQKDQQ